MLLFSYFIFEKNQSVNQQENNRQQSQVYDFSNTTKCKDIFIKSPHSKQKRQFLRFLYEFKK